MAESIELTAPHGTQTTVWYVEDLKLHLRRSEADPAVTLPDASYIRVELIGQNGMRFSHEWRGQSAHDDIIALNKLNLSTKSLQKRILEKLLAGPAPVFVGTIAGVPD